MPSRLLIKKPLIAGLARSARRCLGDHYVSCGLSLRATARLKLQFSGHSPTDSRQIEERQAILSEKPEFTYVVGSDAVTLMQARKNMPYSDFQQMIQKIVQ